MTPTEWLRIAPGCTSGVVISVIILCLEFDANTKLLALDLHQLGGDDLEAVVSGIVEGIAGRDSHGYAPAFLGGAAAMALVAILMGRLKKG
jgi:hypothetical protein